MSQESTSEIDITEEKSLIESMAKAIVESPTELLAELPVKEVSTDVYDNFLIKKSTNQKGEIAQLKVQLEAIKRGFTCSIPTTEVRYDLIIDDNLKMNRVQIKSCNRKDKRGLQLRLDRRGSLYTKEEIDFILVYVPLVDTILCYPPEIFHNKIAININLYDENSKYYWEKFIW